MTILSDDAMTTLCRDSAGRSIGPAAEARRQVTALLALVHRIDDFLDGVPVADAVATRIGQAATDAVAVLRSALDRRPS